MMLVVVHGVPSNYWELGEEGRFLISRCACEVTNARSTRLLGSFGATVAIVALALGPFSQQIATYKIRSVESDIGAIIPRALNFTPALVGNTSTSE
jgi:hypothetical protein